MMRFADRLEQRVGPGFNVKNEGGKAVTKLVCCSRAILEKPDNLDDLYDSLEESDHHQAQAILSRLSRLEAGSLATHIREKLLRDREAVAGDIERELQVSLTLA
jgi:breast cancer 2 susceptibility protein